MSNRSCAPPGVRCRLAEVVCREGEQIAAPVNNAAPHFHEGRAAACDPVSLKRGHGELEEIGRFGSTLEIVRGFAFFDLGLLGVRRKVKGVAGAKQPTRHPLIGRQGRLPSRATKARSSFGVAVRRGPAFLTLPFLSGARLRPHKASLPERPPESPREIGRVGLRGCRSSVRPLPARDPAARHRGLRAGLTPQVAKCVA